MLRHLTNLIVTIWVFLQVRNVSFYLNQDLDWSCQCCQCTGPLQMKTNFEIQVKITFFKVGSHFEQHFKLYSVPYLPVEPGRLLVLLPDFGDVEDCDKSWLPWLLLVDTKKSFSTSLSLSMTITGSFLDSPPDLCSLTLLFRLGRCKEEK